MLERAILPTEADLMPLLAEATENQTESEFVTSYVKNLASILGTKPIMYRAYGAYWWPLKALLIEHGHQQFGVEVELAASSKFKLERPALLCAAAWVYHNYNIENGNVFSSSHKVAIEDGEDYDYYLEDLEMESLILR